MIADLKDYYQLLGISDKASGDEIRKAFRGLARLFHPDMAADKSMAEEKFKEINEAYEVLGDPENRRKYDLGQGRWHRFSGFGSRQVRTHGDGFRRKHWNGNFRPYTERPEFRSFYEDFFGARRQRSNSYATDDADRSSDTFFDSEAGRREAQRGNDIEGEIVISLGEVLHGSIHTISVLRKDPFSGEPECRPLHVRIPPGVHDGRVLRLNGRGDYGIAGGPPGDLYLRVKIAEHPHFRVRGSDLLSDIELSPWEALFGAKKPIPTLEGMVSVKVPAGMMAGQRLRLRGRGLPAVEGTRGDLYVAVKVKVRFGHIAKRFFGRR